MSKFKIQKLTAVVAVAHSAATVFNSAATYAANGILYAIKTKIAANTDTSATYTVALVDSTGDVVYSKSGLSGTAGTIFTQLTADQRAALADGAYTVRITFSANQTTTDNTVTVTLLLDRG